MDASRYSVNTKALVRTVDEEAVVLNLDDGQYYGLNAVATVIWEKLRDGQSLDEIVIAVLSDFDVAEDEARQDLEAVISEMLAKGLIVRQEKYGCVEADSQAQ